MSASAPRWLITEEGARQGASVRLQDRPVVIGRDPAAQLRMDPDEDRLVSTRHAEVAPTDGGWVLRDLDSRNGTWMGGERIEGRRVLLRPGDRFRLGRSGPVVVFSDRSPEALGLRPGRRPAPATRSATRMTRRRRWAALGGGAVLALAAAAVVLSFDGTPPEPGPTEPAGGGEAPGTEPVDGTAESTPIASAADTTAARQAREIAALRERIAGLGEELRRSRAESERLERALEDAREGGATRDEVAALERELQEANAAVRRQQLAASIDFDTIAGDAEPATAQIYMEFEGGRVTAATAFGITPGGRLLTNRHVVRGDDGEALLRLGVQYAGSRQVLPARVAAVAPDVDLALIELAEPGAGRYPWLERFNEAVDTLGPGSPVALFGFPLGGRVDDGDRPLADPLVSAGVLMGREGGYLEIEGYGRGGASGSPILDADGQLVGVLVGGRTTGSGERLYAIPVARVLRFIRSVSPAG